MGLNAEISCYILVWVSKDFVLASTTCSRAGLVASEGILHPWAQLFIIKTLIIKYGIYPNIFAEKMWFAFTFAKATHIFQQKNTCELDIVLTRTVNILTTNKLVKLTMH